MVEGVVLLHPILQSKRYMSNFASFLESQGYDVLNLDYPSSKYDILSIATLIRPQIVEFEKHVKIVHFVGHSMGGLVIRAYLHKYRPANLGRVVMLGTPNKGSKIADLLKNFWLYKKLLGPAGQQLCTNDDSLISILGKVDYELGIIAGSNPYSFLGRKIIGKESDGMVSVYSTKIKGMRDHIVIRSGHIMLAFNKKAWQLTVNFLRKGSFDG